MGCFSPERDGVSAQIGSGVVWGGSEVRFRKISARVLQKQKLRKDLGSLTRVLMRVAQRAAGWREHCVLLGISPELFFFAGPPGSAGSQNIRSSSK